MHSLSQRRILSVELDRLRNELADLETMQARVERFVPHSDGDDPRFGDCRRDSHSSQTLDQVEFVSLPERRVLMIVATRDHMVRNRVVSLNEQLSLDELQSIRNYL